MNETQLIQGRLISPQDIEQIRALMIENPKWHRTRLSIEICRLWNWIDAIGRLKDMACRTLLLKLDRRGLIHLPARVGPSTNHRRSKSFQPLAHDTTPIEGSLALLQPIQLLCADSAPVAAMWQTLLSAASAIFYRLPLICSRLMCTDASNWTFFSKTHPSARYKAALVQFSLPGPQMDHAHHLHCHRH